MDDQSIVRIMQKLDLDYSQAILSTLHFQQSIQALNQQLGGMKSIAIQAAKDINRTFAEQLGQVAGSKTIVDQYGKPLVTIQTEAKKATSSLSSMAKSAQSAAMTAASSLDAASNAAKKHGDTVEEAAKKYDIFGNEMQRRVSWFLTGKLFYGSINAAKEAIQTISEVEMGMTEIARVMEDATFVFEDYRNELLQLGIQYGQTFDVVQDIALRWAQAGYGVRDSLELTKTSLLALNTAELDAQNATESLIGIMAQWGLQASDLMLVLDKINKTADDYTVTSQDLIDGLLRSSSAAKIMNLSLDETIALLTVMREASGRTGREVGNALNSILSYIQRAGSINVLEKMGIQVFADAERTQFRNVLRIFEDIAAKWNTVSAEIQDGFVKAADDAGLFNEELATALGLQEQWNDLQQRDIAQAAAGVYRRNYFIAMIERLSEAQEVLNNMMDAAGYSMQENERTMDTLEKKYESLKAAAQALAVALGDAGLLDILKGLTDMATNAAESISKLDPKLRALLTTALELLAVAQAIKSIGSLFGVNATLGAAMDAMPKLLGTATAAAPGWTRLIPLIIAAAGALGLYLYNANQAASGTAELRREQDKLNQSYTSRLKSIEDTKNEILSQAKAAETLTDKLEELSRKENLNTEEKAQLKYVIEQLNKIFPQLNIQIDEQTGKINTNTEAIRKNIEALRAQAIAEGYRSRALAVGELYAEQEMLVGRTKTSLDEAKAKLAEMKANYENVLREIADIRERYTKGEIKSYHDAATMITGVYVKYGYPGMHPDEAIANQTKEIERLTSLLNEQTKQLEAYENEINEYTTKALELMTEEEFYGTTKTGTSGVPNFELPDYVSATLSDPDKLRALLNANKISLKTYYDNLLRIRKEQYSEFLNMSQDELNRMLSDPTTADKAKAFLSLEQEIIQTKERIENEAKRMAEAPNEALQAELKLLDHRKRIGELTTEEEIKQLKRLQAQYTMNADERLDIIERIYDAEKNFSSETLKEQLNYIEHKARMEEISAEEELQLLKKVYDTYSMDAKDRMQLAEKIHDKEKSLNKEKEKQAEELQKKVEQLQKEWTSYYKEQLSEQQDALKKAYKERIDLIEKEAEAQKKVHEDRIKQIEDELKAIDRAEQEHDYEQRMQELREKEAYWSVRTSEEARKNLAEVRKQIADEEHDREVELRRNELQDEKETLQEKIRAIEDAAKAEKERWEAAFENIEAAFDSHAIDIIATAGNMAEGAFQQWVDKYYNPLMELLKEGTAESISSKAAAMQVSTLQAEIKQLASQIVEYKRQYELEGNTFAHQQAKLYYQRLSDIAPSVAEQLQKMNYEQAKKYVKQLHTGGRTLSYGIAEVMPGELVFPPDLSTRLDALINALYQRTSSSVSNITDNRRSINIEKLLNIENNYMEDDIDAEFVGRVLRRELLKIPF